MEEILEIELTENTILDLPQNLFYNRINNYLLVISQNTANWIGLFNEEQERIFGLLYEKYTLGEVAQLSNNEEDFNFIVSQIVDKNFISTQSVKFNVPHNEGLYIYLTNDCNLSCTHCYMYSGKPKINELEKEEWIRIIKNAKNNGITAITFTGGEVLQYKDWFEVVKFAKENNMTVTLLTNGVLWDKDIIEKSKIYIDEVQISLDGTNENQNAIVRGKENFQKALTNVKLFVKAGIKTVVATTPTLDNVKEIEKNYISFAKELLNELQSEHLYFKISQKLITGRKVKALIQDKAKEYSTITRNLANTLYPNSDIRNFINNMGIGTGLKNCGYGGISISSDGKFFLCNRVEDIEPIATNKDDFKAIIKKANYYYEWSSVDNVMPCMSCELKYICGGGCRIDEYHFAGKQSEVTELQPLIKIDCTQEYKNSIYEKMLGSIKYTYQVD
ncbi:radical SAM/SPASM domain-containing protein [Aliarcobacter butzleri]|uniref:radical SAM/SPASM domain-containing protein n=1 Tax=Aliarcobacter butzleri TaxID=28197 RepID=UPI00125FA4A7|nr:radical SAM protein [Aliarcobacter butzleri]